VLHHPAKSEQPDRDFQQLHGAVAAVVADTGVPADIEEQAEVDIEWVGTVVEVGGYPTYVPTIRHH
jgi:hypothetical protein